MEIMKKKIQKKQEKIRSLSNYQSSREYKFIHLIAKIQII
jgi:hypothetical protein